MSYFAHMDELLSEASSTDAWSWSSPLGLGVFIASIALTLALLSWTIKNLSSIEAQEKRRK